MGRLKLSQSTVRKIFLSSFFLPLFIILGIFIAARFRLHHQTIEPNLPALPNNGSPSVQISRPILASPSPATTPLTAPAHTPTQKVIALERSETGCFTIRYTHKKLATHSDMETCLEHENGISLRIPESLEISKTINRSSICVWIDGKAVSFRQASNHANQLILGPHAGPQSTITARFCLGRSTCPQICRPKQDELMSALGADDTSDDPSGSWDGSKDNSEDEAQLNSEVRKLDHESKQLDSQRSIFTDWLIESTAATCEAPQ